MTGKAIAEFLEATPRAANALIAQFVQLGILEEVR